MAHSYGPVATDRNKDQPHVKRMMPIPFLLQARQVTRILRLLPETVDASTHCHSKAGIPAVLRLM